MPDKNWYCLECGGRPLNSLLDTHCSICGTRRTFPYTYPTFRRRQPPKLEDLSTEDLSTEDLSTEDLSTEDLSTENLSTEDLSTEDVSIGGPSIEGLSSEDLATQTTLPSSRGREFSLLAFIRENQSEPRISANPAREISDEAPSSSTDQSTSERTQDLVTHTNLIYPEVSTP